MAGTALLLLAACGDRGANTANTQALTNAQSVQRCTADDADLILCAHGNDAFQRTCAVERTQGDRGLILTVRHDDGGFHRLLVTQDGHGVIAADGAEAARVSIIDPQSIEVAIGSDRYRLPATIASIQ
ncbi:hypothetical protein DC429_07655 [Arthrobacter sp. TPD3018]|nr:hypothetical protein DC425_07645 [Sphingomonas sp. TPD3009]PVE61726.1 hypothetical protein DC429_07655 [Arthrobacter sp. TPD3018]PVE85357.1 hypothetical protein DC431_05530 [Sphingomonas melonis]